MPARSCGSSTLSKTMKTFSGSTPTPNSISRKSKRSPELAARRTIDAAPRQPRRRRPWLVRQDWYFAVALASFVGVVVWFGRAVEDFFTPPARDIPAPMLVGETLSDALHS